jgi:hypothetical protein
MDNTNPVAEVRMENKKEKPLLFVKPSQTIYGSITSKVKDLLSGSSLLQKTIVVGGGALILMNIILTILASLKVLGVLISL